MKSLLASMLAGEFTFGSEMIFCRALQNKCEICSCSHLIKLFDQQSTHFRRVAMCHVGLQTRFASTPGAALASRALDLNIL